MSYRQVMDDAIGDAPVSTVDIDTVIARQRRAGEAPIAVRIGIDDGAALLLLLGSELG